MLKTSKWMVAVLAGIGAAGCSHDPFFPTLTFPMPGKFEASKNTAPVRISEWWKRLGSEELNRFMAIAADANLDINVAVARLDQAEAQAGIAESALFPIFSYSGDASRSQSSGTNNPGVISKPSIRNSFSKVINASYIVDVWGLNHDLVRSALLNRDASAYQVEVVRLVALAAAANDFLVYVANRERVAVARENLKNAERVLGIIKERFAAGTASSLDVAQQESLVAAQRVAIPTLVLAAETSRTALALVIGRPPQGFHPRTRSTRSLRIPSVAAGLPSSLLVRRPDVRAAEVQMAAEDANVDAARKAFLPTIQLTGDAGVQSAALSTLLRPESVVWSIAAGVTQPIFDGGRLHAQLALTEAQRQEMLENYRKSILQALTDVESALIAVRENAARETAQRAAVAAAQEAFALSEQRLREGTIDLTTLLTTQNTLFQAQDSLIQIRLSRLQAVVSLFQALGGDWDDR